MLEPEEREKQQKLIHATENEYSEIIGVLMLTKLMKWTDDTLRIIGKTKLNETLDLYEHTGKLSQEVKDLIYRIEDIFSATAFNHAKEDDEIEMKDCILAVDQLDRIITGEPETEMGTTEAPLALLFPEQELE